MSDIKSIGENLYEDAFEEAKTSLIAREPAIVTAAVVWILTQIGAFLIGHTHLITHDQWGKESTTLTPIISGLILGVLGKYLREKVVPANKVIPTAKMRPGGAFVVTDVPIPTSPVGHGDETPASVHPSPGPLVHEAEHAAPESDESTP